MSIDKGTDQMHVDVDGCSRAAEAVGQGTEDDLAHCARDVLDGCRQQWNWSRSDTWIYLSPAGVESRVQGWKLHIAAMSSNARDILAAVAPLIVREGAPFKFAATRSIVTWLNTADTPRQTAGKFITVYPMDDAQAVRLAHACDRVTRAFAGPAILSDRSLRPGSLVHYRYGAFRGGGMFNSDGELVGVIHDPQGEPVPDERRAWFTPPAWVTDPFLPARTRPSQADHGAGDQGQRRDRVAPDGKEFPRLPASTSKRVLLNGRYVVSEALKHANKGGVYLAEDRVTGRTVVIKEARAHVEAWGRAGVVADILRHEARLLSLLAHSGRTPQILELFEQQGHLFLVLERLTGSMLREHVSTRIAETGQGLGAEELLAMIRQLAETMETLHGAGVLLRDFTPNNLMVLPDNQLRLVDFELAHLLSDGPPPTWGAGTPGFGSPEQMAGRPSGLPDDYYSLGATIAYAALGIAPNLAADRGRVRSLSDRLRDWVAGVECDGGVAFGVSDLVLGCMADDPAQRWGPRRILDALDERRRPPRRDKPAATSTSEIAQALDDIGRWLVRTVDPEGEHLWPTGQMGWFGDCCNVQAGASGVALFLCRASQTLSDPALSELVRTAAKWVTDAVTAEPLRPPGLYFGLSGAAWFLAEASACLKDPTLLEQASELALAVPTNSFNSDVTHGTAGIGLGQLHQWALTGDERFLERAGLAAQAVMAAAKRGRNGVVWPVEAEDTKSSFAGLTSYGFAHGNAGITYFLLSAAAVLREASYQELGLEGLETLLRVARVDHDGAIWEAGEGKGQTFMWPHWCNGSSGVGTTLIRAYVLTGDERYRRMAELSAGMVMRTKWRSGLVQCHGLAGNGEFLLDLHDLTGEQRFRDMALELATSIYIQRIYQEDLVVFPDESGSEVTASFNTGLAGIGSFFLRLLHGGPRPLMVDEMLLQPAGRLGL